MNTPVSKKSADEKSADEHFKKGEESLRFRKYALAIEHFTEAITLRDNAEDYSKRGLAYFDCGQYYEAMKDLEKAIELRKDPNHERDFYEYGIACYSVRHSSHNMDIKQLTEAITLEGNADDYSKRGLAYLKHGKHYEAMKDLEKAIKLRKDPNHERDFYLYGRASFEARDFYYYSTEEYRALELNYLTEAITLRGNAEDYSCRGHFYFEHENYHKAIEDLEKAIKLRENLNYECDYKLYGDYSFDVHYRDYYLYGKAYFKIGDYDKAIEIYLKMIELYDNDYSGYYWCGRAYFYKKNYEYASDYFTECIELTNNNRRSIGSILWRGLAYLEMELYENAIKDFTEVITIIDYAQHLPDPSNLYCTFKQRDDDYYCSYDAYFLYYDVYFLLGTAEFRNGNYEKANIDFAKAIEHRGKTSKVFLVL